MYVLDTPHTAVIVTTRKSCRPLSVSTKIMPPLFFSPPNRPHFFPPSPLPDSLYVLAVCPTLHPAPAPTRNHLTPLFSSPSLLCLQQPRVCGQQDVGGGASTRWGQGGLGAHAVSRREKVNADSSAGPLMKKLDPEKEELRQTGIGGSVANATLNPEGLRTLGNPGSAEIAVSCDGAAAAVQQCRV